uniref:Uncharacterized protein n=1 Tax=Nelumbo nucifera TaxID=4432 RepID=A0A822Y9W6_NELNU|nr:TPA_asm: hypothetical protein HUJ06_029394 [Nelumbo nucifera]
MLSDADILRAPCCDLWLVTLLSTFASVIYLPCTHLLTTANLRCVLLQNCPNFESWSGVFHILSLLVYERNVNAS